MNETRAWHLEYLYGGSDDWYMPCAVCGHHLEVGVEAWVRDDHYGDGEYAQCIRHGQPNLNLYLLNDILTAFLADEGISRGTTPSMSLTHKIAKLIEGIPKFLVTVKLPRNPDHDPHNKIAGACPVSGARCTDITGQHHTILVTGKDTLLARNMCGFPITRIEMI